MPLTNPAPETRGIQALKVLLEVLVLLVLLVLLAALVVLALPVILELPVLLALPVVLATLAVLVLLGRETADVTPMAAPDAPATPAAATSPMPTQVIHRRASRVEDDRNEV